MGRSRKADEILDVAQHLLQTRGYAGFSFRDVADAVGIKSASIHYHFATKADLALTLAKNYRVAFAGSLAGLEATHTSAVERLRGYADLYAHTLEDQGRLCLCAMLASEAELLPDGVRAEVHGFFEEQRRWLTRILREGVERGELELADPEEFASVYLAALEGGMLIARSQRRPADLRRIAAALLAGLEG